MPNPECPILWIPLPGKKDAPSKKRGMPTSLMPGVTLFMLARVSTELALLSSVYSRSKWTAANVTIAVVLVAR